MMLDYENIWSTLPFPSFVVAVDGDVAAANSAAEQFVQSSEKSIKAKGLQTFFGKNSILLETIRQARVSTSSFTQYGVEVATVDRAVLSCNIHVNFLDADAGQILLIIQPTGVADKMSQSMTHLTAVRSVSAMAATLAHEIRNPLAGITGAAQLLAMNANENDVELAEMIEQEARRIGTLVDRVEHFGDQRPTTRNAINIHDVTDKAIRAASVGFASHVNFVKEYDPSLPDAAGDADQLLQVFMNLIRNSADAVGEKHGTIRIRTSYNSSMKFAVAGSKTENLPLQVEVVDNGSGIPEPLLSEVFEPFVSSKVNGTGLGLSLVSKIIAGHGGLIECSSADGRTSFTLRLPLWRGPKE